VGSGGEKVELSDRLIRPIGALGAISCVLACAGWVWSPALPGLLELTAGGVLGTIGWVVFDRTAIRDWCADPASAPKLRAARRCGAGFAGAVTLAALAAGSGAAWDLTRGGTHRPSYAMQATLEDIHAAGVDPSTLDVVLWLARHGDSIDELHGRSFDRIASKLRLTAPKLRLRRLDPADHPEQPPANRTLSVRRGDVEQDSTFDGEESLLSLLRRVALAEERRVVFTEGGGEPRIDGGGRGGLSHLARDLLPAGIHAQAASHLGALAPGDVVAIVGRTRPLDATDRGALRAHVRAGGAAFIALDSPLDAGLESLLAEWGVSPGSALRSPRDRDPDRPMLWSRTGFEPGVGVASGGACSLDLHEGPDATPREALVSHAGEAAAAFVDLHPDGRDAGEVFFACTGRWLLDSAPGGDSNRAFAVDALRRLAQTTEPLGPVGSGSAAPTRSDARARVLAVAVFPGLSLFLAAVLARRRRVEQVDGSDH
jgi:hypothetical protein